MKDKELVKKFEELLKRIVDTTKEMEDLKNEIGVKLPDSKVYFSGWIDAFKQYSDHLVGILLPELIKKFKEKK